MPKMPTVITVLALGLVLSIQSRAAEILSSYLASHQADLLVMGAYGHSPTGVYSGWSDAEHAFTAPAASVVFALRPSQQMR
jgi:hypothetical protein